MKQFHPLFKYIQWPLLGLSFKVNNVMAILSRAMVGMGHVMTVRLVLVTCRLLSTRYCTLNIMLVSCLSVSAAGLVESGQP